MRSDNFLGIKVDEHPLDKFFKKGFRTNPLWWKISGPDGVYRYDDLAKYQAYAPEDYIGIFTCHSFANQYGYWCRDNNDFPTHYALIDKKEDISTLAFWKTTNCRQCGKELFVHGSTFIFKERMPVQKIFDGFFSDRFDFRWKEMIEGSLIRDDSMFSTDRHASRYGNINDHTLCCACIKENIRKENRAKVEEQKRKENSFWCKAWKSFFPEEAE